MPPRTPTGASPAGSRSRNAVPTSAMTTVTAAGTGASNAGTATAAPTAGRPATHSNQGGDELVIILGRTPERLLVHLTASDPFTCVLRRRDSAGQLTDWTTTPVLEFDGGPEWPATLAGADATWSIPDAQVDAAIADCVTRRVRLTLGGIVWASGHIVVGS